MAGQVEQPQPAILLSFHFHLHELYRKHQILSHPLPNTNLSYSGRLGTPTSLPNTFSVLTQALPAKIPPRIESHLVIYTLELTSGDAARTEAEVLALIKPSRISHQTLWVSASLSLVQRGPGKASRINPDGRGRNGGITKGVYGSGPYRRPFLCLKPPDAQGKRSASTDPSSLLTHSSQGLLRPIRSI
jgi:hypothetical protein